MLLFIYRNITDINAFIVINAVVRLWNKWKGADMQEVELKQCPFCGGTIKLDEDDFYMFCCDKCGAGITFAKELENGTATDCTKGESIEKWNRRV